MQLTCDCGVSPEGLQEVGLTSEYELVVHWVCGECSRHVYVVKSLADCCRDCFQDGALMPAGTDVPTDPAADAHFLRSLGIRPE